LRFCNILCEFVSSSHFCPFIVHFLLQFVLRPVKVGLLRGRVLQCLYNQKPIKPIEMKNKRRPSKTIAPASAVAALVALAAGAHASTTPVFNYSFPASWGGTGTVVTDQSVIGNNGFTSGTLALAAAVPPGNTGGTQSINTTAGGVLTTATGLLNNSTVAGNGGFTFNVDFMWNGTDSTSFGHTQKLIDYAGTESLQLVTTSGSASLQMAFADNSGNESTPVSTTILPNTWYDVELVFNTAGNVVDGNGDISGYAGLYVNGTLLSEAAATKGNNGDNLNRQIGIGQLGANFGYLVGFKGDIHDPTVSLGAATAVPEPSSLALGLVGGFGVLGTMWKARRRKS
jgi:hypothetical protein